MKATKTFRGELYEGKAYVGMIHKADGGYIVRTPDGSNGLGPVAFNGRVFAGNEFSKIGSLQLSAARSVDQYELRSAA
jgi:hypothetical protein